MVQLSDAWIGVLIRLNLAAFIFHLALAIVTGVVGNLDMRPPIYTTKNTFVYNATTTGFTLLPRYEEVGDGFPVTILTLSFFTITSFFHLLNVTVFANLYFGSLERCYTPTRWFEYFVTASIMISIIAFLSGTRDVISIAMISGLIASTMLFGFLSELVNRPASETEWEEERLLVRLAPHLFGYVPYVFAWTTILYTFIGSGGICSAPKWVIAIIFAQLILFSLFVVPQLYQIMHAPSKFVRGEVAFIVLSFISKAVLGIILLTGGLAQDKFKMRDNIDLSECDAITS